MSDVGPSISDQELMRQAQAGDRAAFAEIVRRYRPALLRVAKSRLGRDDWAEDAVQETLLAAFQWRASYREPSHFRTWLWTILLNQCRRSWAGHVRLPRLWCSSDRPAEEVEPAVYQASVERGAEPPWQRLLAQERSELLESLLAKLPPAQADALRLRFFAGLKFEEISETMQCSLGTAKNRVKWGLMRLSQLVRQADAASKSDGL
ncbi:MAG TPA: RNA polymerase sigma factor [Pirellulales bacterium]|nr:RNA polymerase sigma factor [Pirellulales bacterium]